MPLILPVAAANAVADHLAGLGTTFSLHTPGGPGPNGTANEASGAGYVRQSGVYPPAVNGATTTAEMVFPVPAGTYTHMCRWNGPTLVEVIDNPDVSLNPAGEVTVTHTVAVAYTLPA